MRCPFRTRSSKSTAQSGKCSSTQARHAKHTETLSEQNSDFSTPHSGRLTAGCSEITPPVLKRHNAPRPARRLAVFACFLIHRMVVAHRSTHRECDIRLRKAVAAGFGHGIMRLSDVLDVPRPSASPQSVSMVVCMVIHGCLVHTCFCFIMFYQPNILVLRF